MHSVPAPPLVVRALPRIALAAVLLALAVAGIVELAVAGDDISPRRPAASTGALIGGVPLQQARCAQWQGGSETQRRRTVDALAHVVGGPTPYGPGTTLPTDQAFALFTRDCASPMAQHFLLYELYIRAAAFRSVTPGG